MDLRTASDLRHEAHQFRNRMEDYRFMIEAGESHGKALQRLGVTEDEWRHGIAAESRRDRRA